MHFVLLRCICMLPDSFFIKSSSAPAAYSRSEVLILCLWQHNHLHNNRLWCDKARIRPQVGDKQQGADELQQNKKMCHLYANLPKRGEGVWEIPGWQQGIAKKTYYFNKLAHTHFFIIWEFSGPSLQLLFHWLVHFESPIDLPFYLLCFQIYSCWMYMAIWF